MPLPHLPHRLPSQNNPESAGGPETVTVAQVDARSEYDAIEKTFEQAVTSFPVDSTMEAICEYLDMVNTLMTLRRDFHLG